MTQSWRKLRERLVATRLPSDAGVAADSRATGLSTVEADAHAAATAPNADPIAASALQPSFVPTTTRYRLIRRLGEGAMGVVYEAEQLQPQRAVALKLIKPGLATDDILRRFELEANALGRLQHPGIAHVYEAGSEQTAHGPQPYFAMELIRGRPLDACRDSPGLDTHRRLELVAKVCDAVHHAHQRGIIHRDLKPSNILLDDGGHPKILDFGVARVTDSDSFATRMTEVGRLVGTVAYMSPEQALADPLELDTRTDVYAIGVILYELLAGRLPYPIGSFLPDALRTIREAEAVPLGSIRREYRGDIETIAAKALEKDKGRRYQSAAALAADIRRYLAHEPIAARPASAGYQLRKFAQRHRPLVAAAAMTIAAMIAGTAVSTWEALRARRAEQAALAAKQVEQAVNEFLHNDLLAQASISTQAGPHVKADPDLKVRTALDRAAAGIEGKFASQPVVEAAIRHTIGDTYRDLGLLPAAEVHLKRAVDLRRRTRGDDDPDTLASRHALALVHARQAQYAEAEGLLLGVLEARRRRLGEHDPTTLAAMNDLADVYRTQAKYAQAEPLLATYLESIRQVRGDGHRDVAAGMVNLAALLQAQARYAEAEPLYAQSLEIRRRVLGNEHPDTLVVMNDSALLYTQEGRYADAERLYREALDIKRRLLGEEHSETVIGMANLGNLYARAGDYARAEPLIVRSLAIRRRVLSDRHPLIAVSVNNLAVLYSRQGRYAEAGPLYAEALAVRTRALGPEHPDTIQSMNNLAVQYRDEGKFSDAESLQRTAIEAQRRALGDTDPRTLQYKASLATIYRDAGRLPDALELQRHVLDVQRRTLGDEHLDTLSGLEVAATILEAQKAYGEAESAARRAADGRRRVLGATHPDALRATALLARVLIRQKQFAAAETLLSEDAPIYEKTMADHWRRFMAASLLGASLAGQGKRAEAEPLLIRGYEGLTQRAASIPAGSRAFLREAGLWIIQLYEAWGKNDKAAEWRIRVRKPG